MKKVYLIQADEDGPIKIGVATNVSSRFSSLQVATHIPLKLLGLIDGDEKMERRLHKKFEDLHLRGEWFMPGTALMDFAAALPPPPPVEVREKKFALDPGASKIWFDMSIRTDLDAAKKIGRNRSTIKSHLGPSGRTAGGLSTERARELGKAGAAASPATKPKGGRMPYRQMAKIINAAPTLAAAIEEINATNYEPVTKIWLYRAKRAGKLIFKKRRGATGAKPST